MIAWNDVATASHVWIADKLDTPLLILMPTGIFLTLLVYIYFSVRMSNQDAQTPLGRWLVIMYTFMAFKNLCLVMLFGRFAWLWWDDDLSAWVLFMIPLDVFAIATAFAGYRVMVWHARIDRMLASPGHQHDVAEINRLDH